LVDTEEGARMRPEASMAKRKRRQFTEEFKQEAVRLCRQNDRSIGQVAQELDLTDSALRNWVKQYEVDHGANATEALTTDEKDELRKLRRENRVLREEREILKKAAAFFAKENP
jgi:transposase